MFIGEEGDRRQPEEDDDVVGDAELLGSFQRLQKTRQSTAMPRSTARPRRRHGGRGDDEEAAAMALRADGESSRGDLVGRGRGREGEGNLGVGGGRWGRSRGAGGGGSYPPAALPARWSGGDEPL